MEMPGKTKGIEPKLKNKKDAATRKKSTSRLMPNSLLLNKFIQKSDTNSKLLNKALMNYKFF